MKSLSRIRKMNTALEAREISALELVETSFDAIKAQDQVIGAFLHLRKEAALEAAKQVDLSLSRGESMGPLVAVPFGLKDNIMLKGEPCTAASKILEPYIASYDATVVDRLKKRGAICVGKTNLDEFAMGSSTEHSALKKTVNPADHSRVPGGSSGGSAAAVAADMVPLALGSDTGGSIRQPAALCGVVGFKPTYGQVSRFGLMALASSFDQIGPISHTVEDAAIVFDAISGIDPFDATTTPRAFEYSANDFSEESRLRHLKGLSLGLVTEFLPESLSPGARANFEKAVGILVKNGARVKTISLPLTKLALPVYYVIMPAEASSNLARYDGIRYPLSVSGRQLTDTYVNTRELGFGDEATNRVILGTFVLSSGYFDAYYKKAKAVQAQITADYEATFNEVDVLITPTVPTPAFKFGENTADPIAMYTADIFTVTANLVGAPAISVPSGQVDGLPFGFQIMGRPGADTRVLQTAASYELLSSHD